MTTGKQLFSCIAFLVGAYSNLNMCMEQQVSEQKLDFDTLPLNVQEQIMSYLPADNLYRALWSRCHNASQQFHNDIVKVYLRSHLVPHELIDKTIAQNFTIFKGSEKQKQEFQDKVKSAFERYNEFNKKDAEIVSRLSQFKQKIFNREKVKSLRLANLFMEAEVFYEYNEQKALRFIKSLIKQNNGIANAKIMLYKMRTIVECYRSYLPPVNQNKAVLMRLLHTLINKYDEIPETIVIAIISGYLSSFCLMRATDSNNFTSWFLLGITLSALYFKYAKDCVRYVHNKTESSFDRSLLEFTNEIEVLKTRISQMINTVNELEKADFQEPNEMCTTS